MLLLIPLISNVIMFALLEYLIGIRADLYTDHKGCCRPRGNRHT